MLTDMQLRALKPAKKIYKVADQRGLYAAVTPSGAVSFRYDYRVNGRRETLVIGRYDPSISARKPRKPDELGFGMAISLPEARLLRDQACGAIQRGESPSRAKVEKRVEATEALTFGKWAEKYFVETALADSTRAMRKSVYERNLASEFGRLKLEEITPARLMARCEKIKERGAAAPAVQARDIVLQVYRFVQARGLKVDNPAEAIRPSAIASFKPRDRTLSPAEIHVFFSALEQTPTMPTLRLAIKFMLLTLVRKSEFILAMWSEIDFDAAVWTIPKERMKAGRPHIVYLSQQALDILVAFKTCFGASSYVHPGRYETASPISMATLNRVIDSTVKLIRDDGQILILSRYMICVGRPARCCTKQGSTPTGSRNASLTNSVACAPSTTRRSMQSRGGRCSKRGQICWTAGLLRIQRRASWRWHSQPRLVSTSLELELLCAQECTRLHSDRYV